MRIRNPGCIYENIIEVRCSLEDCSLMMLIDWLSGAARPRPQRQEGGGGEDQHTREGQKERMLHPYVEKGVEWLIAVAAGKKWGLNDRLQLWRKNAPTCSPWSRRTFSVKKMRIRREGQLTCRPLCGSKGHEKCQFEETVRTGWNEMIVDCEASRPKN